MMSDRLSVSIWPLLKAFSGDIRQKGPPMTSYFSQLPLCFCICQEGTGGLPRMLALL